MHVSCLELLNLVPRVDGNIGNEVRGGHNQSREEGNRTSRKNRVSVFIDLTPRFLLPPFDMYAICAYVSGHPSNVFLFACDFEGQGGGRIWVAQATSAPRSLNTNSSGEAATIDKLVQGAPRALLLRPLLWAYRILRPTPNNGLPMVALLLLALESKYSTLFS